jgi:hypothetical protein
MLDTAIKKVLAEIEQLSSEQQKELFHHLEKKISENSQDRAWPLVPRVVGQAPPPKDRSKEYQWLEEHRMEYARQWVALNGDNLISRNTNCRVVIDEARQKGVPDALIVYVEPPDAQSLVVW